MIQSIARRSSRAEDLSHRVGHARRGQQPADLRIVGVGVQIAQQDRRLAQGEVEGNHGAKLLAAFPFVARAKCGSSSTRMVRPRCLQADQHGVAIAAAAVVGQGNPLPELDRQPAEQAVARVQAIPVPRVGGEQPGQAEPLAQLARLIELLPGPRAVDFLEGHEIEVLQALGHAVHVAAAVERPCSRGC